MGAECALHFSTGASEREGRNPAANPEVVLTTGDNTLSEGIDVVTEGRAERVTDGDRLNRPAAAWESKYGPEWHFDVQDGTFRHADHVALVFEVSPRTAFGFGKGTTYSQTRRRFSCSARPFALTPVERPRLAVRRRELLPGAWR